jgi:antitoxin component YwqK of YwqJK toxin-antitoxin module
MLRFFFFFVSITAIAQTGKEYQKIKGENGEIIAEGWIVAGLKNDYWLTYFSNNILASEGHFKNGLKEKYWYFYQSNKQVEKEGHFSLGLMSDWWVFYDEKGAVICKIQYEKGKKEGYCIQYKKGEVIKIEKYQSDLKTGSWKDLKSFELENDFKDLL